MFTRLISALLCCLFGLALLPSLTHAAPTLTCSSNMVADSEDALNQAIACFNAQTSGTTTITLSAEIVLSASSTPINNVHNSAELILDGNGFTIDGNHTTHAFDIYSGKVTIQDITIQHGNHSSGGAIYNQGVLTILRSTLKDNETNSSGGAIYNHEGQLNIIESLLLNNKNTGGVGGALRNFRGTVTITNSTISQNEAYMGGGIFNTYGNSYVTIVNSTISENHVHNSGQGGGVYNYNPEAAKMIITNSILSDNTHSDCYGPAALAYSLISASASGSCNAVNGENGNLIGRDPQLLPLADNGGPTLTYALSTGADAPASLASVARTASPAIDAANSAECPTTDQRGLARPDDACDIGSFEVQPDPTAIGLGQLQVNSAETTTILLWLSVGFALLLGSVAVIVHIKRRTR